MISTAEQLVDALGGTSATAGIVGVDKRVVSNWKTRGRVPAEYFLTLSAALAKAGEAAEPAVFGLKAEVAQ